jgi:hypothetical protein
VNKHDIFGPIKDQDIQSKKKNDNNVLCLGKPSAMHFIEIEPILSSTLSKAHIFIEPMAFLPYTSKSHENSNNGLPPLCILISSQKGSSG